VDTIKDRDEFYPKRLLETLSKRSEARQETLSLPEVVTNVMAIINEELLLPPKSIRGTNLYIHPDLMEFSLNDFNRAEEIISVGYHTAVESASFRAAVSRIAGRTAPPSPVPGEPSR
jgi:predicted acylesterase/phospholipase RssA